MLWHILTINCTEWNTKNCSFSFKVNLYVVFLISFGEFKATFLLMKLWFSLLDLCFVEPYCSIEEITPAGFLKGNYVFVFRLSSLKKANRPKEYNFAILMMTCRPSTSDQQLQCLSSVPVQNQVGWWRVFFGTIRSFMTERHTQHSREKFQVKFSDEGLNYNIYFERKPHQPLLVFMWFLYPDWVRIWKCWFFRQYSR